MTRVTCILVLFCLCGAAAAQSPRRRVPSREELGNAIADLELRMAALREELRRGDLQRSAAAEERLAAVEKAVGELRQQAAAGDLATRVEQLGEALDELREEAARKQELKKYVRKPDEKQFKSRSAQELELRLAFTDLRQDEIAGGVARLGMLGKDPALPAKGKGILAAVGALGDLLLANDQRARPRLLLRLTWETSRFIDEQDYLFVSATPELQLFVYPHDLDRALMPRDVAAPRDRLGLIVKKAAAGVSLGRLGLSAGVLQFTHGAGFFVNPTNVFTPKSPLDPRREVDGVPAARVDLALVSRESLTLSAQVAAVADRVRNDVLGEHGDALGFGGMALLRADTPWASLTGIGLWQRPDALGRTAPAAGGILSLTPFGLTASVEALFGEGPDGGQWRPELVASLQGFTSKIGANGTTYVLEYLFNDHMPGNAAQASADLVRMVEREQSIAVIDRLTRPLARRHYANMYLEPSVTQKLRVNLAALVGFDEEPGALLRAGFDYDLYNFTVHAFGGATIGADASELNHHFIRSFAELAIFASF